VSGRFGHDDDARAAAERAAARLREELGAMPVEADARVLAAVLAAGREPEAAAPGRRRGAARARAWLGRAAGGIARPRVALAGAAVLAAIAVWGPSLQPLNRTDTAAAVTIARLPGECPRDRRGPGRIEVAGVWSGAEAHRFARVLRRFERETGVRVDYRYETRNIAPKLRARVARGCPPDVALLPQPGLMAELARAGALRPLDAATRAAVRAGYSPAWQALGTVDGRLYGVWFKASNKSVLWYRPQALRAAGVTHPPTTWDELVRVARRLAAAGIRPLSVAGADGWPLTDWFENVYLRTAGPELYDRLARHEIPWTHPSVVRALRLMAGVIGDPKLAGSARAIVGRSFERSVRDALTAGAHAALLHEADFVGAYADPGHARFTAFPAIGHAADGLVVGGDVAVQLAGAAAARRLMRFLATARAAAAWAPSGGFVSPHRGVPASAYPDAASARSAAMLATARTVRFDLSDLQPPVFGATAGQGMWRLFQELVLQGPDGAEEIAARLETAARAAGAGG